MYPSFPTNALELSWLLTLQHEWRSQVGDLIFTSLSWIGDYGALWILLALLLLAYKPSRPMGVTVLGALLLSLLVSNGLLKNLIARARPFNFVSLPMLVPPPTDFSFPSGHTSAAFATLGVFLIIKPWRHHKGYLLATGAIAVIAIGMAFSRLYLFVHFPTDILAGAIIGFSCSSIAHLGHKKLSKLRRQP